MVSQSRAGPARADIFGPGRAVNFSARWTTWTALTISIRVKSVLVSTYGATGNDLTAVLIVIEGTSLRLSFELFISRHTDSDGATKVQLDFRSRA